MIFFDVLKIDTNFKNVFSSTPNLFSFFPVEICFKVFASVFGFNLIPIFTTTFFFLAIFSIIFISLSDSEFISNIFFSIANLSSLSVFPTPENTIFFLLIPALSASISSPFDTTSAPSPNFFISLIKLRFVFDLIAKQTNGENFLKCVKKFIMLLLNLLYE